MKPRSEMSMELYDMMLDRGYPEEFCDLITKNLNTDFTAGRMIGYLSHYQEQYVEHHLFLISHLAYYPFHNWGSTPLNTA